VMDFVGRWRETLLKLLGLGNLLESWRESERGNIVERQRWHERRNSTRRDYGRKKEWRHSVKLKKKRRG